MRNYWIATWTAIALCTGCAGTGAGPAGTTTAAYGPSPAGALASTPPANYGPVQPANWSDKLQAAVMAPFRMAPPTPKAPRVSEVDPLLLSREAGPATPELFASMAGISEQMGDFDQARRLYREAIRLEPESSEAALGMARLEDRQGQLEEALRWYKQAAHANPADASVANDYGLCLARAGRLQEALSPVGQAVRLEPQNPLYRNNIAKVLVGLDRPAEAAQHLAAVHSPATVNFNMAVLLIDQGRVEEAARCLQLATTLDPQLTAANELLAEMTAPEPGADAETVAADDGVDYTAQRPAEQVLVSAIVEAQQEAQPWPGAQTSAAPSTPTAPNAAPLAPQDHFAEPVLLPAVD